MDLTICQSCKEAFNQNQRLPKVLSCGCVHCQKCLQNFSQASDIIKCKTHKNLVSIEEQHVKDFQIKDYFMQELNKFEQQSELEQVIQDLSSQAKLQKSKVTSIIKVCRDFQKLFNEIVRQVTQILYQKELSGCQRAVFQIEQVLKEIKTISMKYKQIKSLKMVTGQEYNKSLNALNILVKEYEGLQAEIKRLRDFNTQESSNQNYRSIQEVSFQVFQELMGMSQEQRLLIQDFSVIISKYISQQNLLIPNQLVQGIMQPLLKFRDGSLQQLQNFLSEFQSKQIDVSYILNNSQGTMNFFKKAMILYDLIQLKSEKNQQHLLQILNLAKNQPKMQIASTNALTILNYMNFQFTNQDFQNFDLTNVDLSDTIFTNCNFINSNLTQANLCNTKFISCDFTNSNLTSIITEHPHIFNGHTDRVTSIAISSDSELIVSGSQDKTVRLWDVKTGNSQTLSGHKSYVYSVAISSDSLSIVSGSADNTIMLWNIKTGISKTMSGHTSYVTAVAISSDQEFIVSGSHDKTVRLWDIKTGTSKTMSDHTLPVNSIAISSDSEFIVSGSGDATIILWNVKTGTCKTMSGHTSYVWSVAISSDSEFIASGSDDQTIMLWDVKSLTCIKVLSGHSSVVLSVIFSFDGRYILSGSEDKTIRVWNAQSGQCECVLCGHTDSVGSLSLSRDNNWLVSSNGSY